jgi:hypothetical protein
MDKQPPLLTREQQHDCDTLLGFVIRCRQSARRLDRVGYAQTKGQRPLTFEDFKEAVEQRMPDKSDQEKLYLLTYGAHYLRVE